MKILIYLVMILLSGVINQDGFASSCVQGDATHIWIAPQVVKAGMPVNIMAVSTSEPIHRIAVDRSARCTTNVRNHSQYGWNALAFNCANSPPGERSLSSRGESEWQNAGMPGNF